VHPMNILVTGVAGFIGYHLTARLLQDGHHVVGIDNLNDYYDVRLKIGRLQQLGLELPEGVTASVPEVRTSGRFSFYQLDLQDKAALAGVFRRSAIDRVVNLAAQAGVRYSLSHPDSYISTNVQGFLNLLEVIREHPVDHFVYASSSSVYGIDPTMPFSEITAADHPASLYAVSKRTDELMAHAYSHLYGIPSTGLRFFTVYGPWGRPDMALFLFTKAILEGRPIDVFNEGDMQRDFTYVDDIVEGIVRVMDQPPKGLPEWDGRQSGISSAPYRVYNIGNGSPVRLLDFIDALEEALGVKAEKNMMPIQPGDVPRTWADCSALERDTGYKPGTDIRVGVKRFVEWYKRFYGVDS
jgi:UDP-glucuronate 4-epimerase